MRRETGGGRRKKYLPLNDGLYDYLLEVSLRESALLRRLREETAQMEDSLMQVAPDQGQFMALLARLIGARRALEIGVFTGYSSLCVAQALPADGLLTACDISEEWTAIARRYLKEAGVDHKINLMLAAATDTLRRMIDEGETGSYDFAFIDADKSNYSTYFDLTYQLVRSGGVILFDNTLWEGKLTDSTVQDEDTIAIRAINQELARDERIDLSLLSIADGLTLVLKK